MGIKKKIEQVPDDTEHLILYRSPGPHSGGGPKTFDMKHTKSDAETEEALASGEWFRTLEEAYVKKAAPAAPEPKKTPKGPPEGATVAESKAEAPEDGPTLDDVKDALKALNEQSPKAVKAVLKKHGVAAAPMLKPAQYAEVLADINAALEV